MHTQAITKKKERKYGDRRTESIVYPANPDSVILLFHGPLLVLYCHPKAWFFTDLYERRVLITGIVIWQFCFDSSENVSQLLSLFQNFLKVYALNSFLLPRVDLKLFFLNSISVISVNFQWEGKSKNDLSLQF